MSFVANVWKQTIVWSAKRPKKLKGLVRWSGRGKDEPRGGGDAGDYIGRLDFWAWEGGHPSRSVAAAVRLILSRAERAKANSGRVAVAASGKKAIGPWDA